MIESSRSALPTHWQRVAHIFKQPAACRKAPRRGFKTASIFQTNCAFFLLDWITQCLTRWARISFFERASDDLIRNRCNDAKLSRLIRQKPQSPSDSSHPGAPNALGRSNEPPPGSKSASRTDRCEPFECWPDGFISQMRCYSGVVEFEPMKVTI